MKVVELALDGGGGDGPIADGFETGRHLGKLSLQLERTERNQKGEDGGARPTESEFNQSEEGRT